MMFTSLKTSLRGSSAFALACARRHSTRSFSSGRVYRGNFGRVVVGGGAVVATSYLAWKATSGRQHVLLDSPELPKKRKPKSTPQDPEGSSSNPTAEFLQEKEEEAVKEAKASSSSVTSTDAASSSPGDGSEEGGAEAANTGAFNPETGEINWDCPCLGGMAHGPCGMEFRDAFSCFVFSEEEPKGINCVEKFKAMQDCFRAHPETYGDQLTDDDDDEDDENSPESKPVSSPSSDDRPVSHENNPSSSSP